MSTEATNSKAKKSSVLGANALSFIQKVASGDLSGRMEPRADVEMHETPTLASVPRSETETSLDKAASTLAESLNAKCSTCDQADPTGKFGVRLIAQAKDEYNAPSRHNYLKGCKWSPDGTCIMTNSEDSILRIFDTTAEMYAVGSSESAEQGAVQELTPSLKLREPEIIYDYAWYPFMTSSDPLTACVFSTCKDNPIHLYDAFTGLVRCSYKGYNHLDELVSAYCIGFNSSCANIYCGYKKGIKVFDITRPGRNYEDIDLDKGQYKLPGIVSCIRFSTTGIYAVGTYMRHIGIYVESTNECMFTISQAHSNGITHLAFSPDGNRLFSGARKDPHIHCWDMRNPGKILRSYERRVSTNQRIYFSMDSAFNWLCSGNSDGTVSVWPLEADVELAPSEDAEPGVKLSVHSDCVNGVSFHPTLPLLATTSGERRLDFELSSDDSSSDEDLEALTSVIEENALKIFKYSFAK